MRKEILEVIIKRLLQIAADGTLTAGETDEEGNIIEPLIKHIDLWNRNVEFIEQDESWARPAVFVEFSPINWEGVKTTATEVHYRCKSTLLLHIVTDWAGPTYDGSTCRDEELANLDLSEWIQRALLGAAGDSFHRLELQQTASNHDHEELVEQIETYSFVGMRTLTL